MFNLAGQDGEPVALYIRILARSNPTNDHTLDTLEEKSCLIVLAKIDKPSP
jgi:hypothetical protein